MKILSITPSFQHPAVPGSHRHYHFIKELSKRHEITLFTLASEAVPAAAMEEMRSYTQEIYMFDVADAPQHSRLGKMIYRMKAIRRMRRAFKDFVEKESVDVILFHGKALSSLIANTSIPVVVDICDSMSMRIMSQLRFEGMSNTPRRFAQYLIARKHEKTLLRTGDRVVFISARDRSATVGASDQSLVIPNGVDLEFWKPTCNQSERNTLALTGVMNYRPNEDASLLLMQRIMPRLRQSVERPHLLLIGRAPTHQMQTESDSHVDITVTGFVDDVRPWIQRAEVFVAPIQFASGMQNKVMEAMAMRLPVVTTSIVAEGIQVNGLDDVPVVIADGEQRFADAVVRLLNDPDERERLGNAGRAYVKRHFSWIESAMKFEELCREAVAAKDGSC